MAFFSLLLLLPLLAGVTADDPPSFPKCNKDDERALTAFRDTVGVPGTNPFPSWNASIAPCCEWYGVVCDPKNFRVYELDIGGDQVRTIPPAVGGFPTLQVLRLHKLPSLTGPIPVHITKLHRLRFLTISWTSISGPVPAFLSTLINLEQLDLSFNLLSGAIPPALGALPKCYSIDISRNNLTGTLPSTLFSSLNGTSPYLSLSHNFLTGVIPLSFAKINFANIDLSRNHLTGGAGFLFGANKSLEQIDLSRNQLSFNLSTVVFPKMDLVSVDLNHNMIYGEIPMNIVDITNNNFNFFNVSYNQLCGRIPVGGPTKQFGASSYIHNKCLCGTPLPSCK